MTTTIKRDCHNCGGDGFTTDSPRCPACDGEGKVNDESIQAALAREWLARHKDDVEIDETGIAKLVDAFAHAVSINKFLHLQTVLDRACFPTFFGEPAVTVLGPDFATHSLYFEIYPRRTPKAERRGKFLMNGGVIWHDSAGEWSVHT